MIENQTDPGTFNFDTVATKSAPVHGNSLHALHYLSSCVLLASICSTETDLWTFIVSASILEKYGFLALLLIILEGTHAYMGSVWNWVRKFFPKRKK